jgi:hypothetical protein
VLLLDLDGTLIGRISCAVCEYELVKFLHQDAPSDRTRALKAMRDALVARLRYGIIRPHVEAFCRSVKGMDPSVELFIYTASDTEWASFIVPCVEAALGTRFNRPIFSRAHCVAVSRGPQGGFDYKKSVVKVLPAVFRALKKRYPALRSVRDLMQHAVLVDNTPDVMLNPAEAARLLACPTYAYNYVYDVLARVNIDVLHRHFARLIPVLVRAGLFPQASSLAHPITNYQMFAAAYYAHLGKTLADAHAPNSDVLRGDRFWVRLLHAVVDRASNTEMLVKTFTPRRR